ncbi:DNA repair and recombination protein RAD54 and RAD54-like protein [Marchantia polymorpha subsp. ruderalis]
MAPRSLASSSLKSDTKVNPLQAEDMYIRRPQHDQSGSTCSQKARFPRASADENSATSKPRLEGFCRGSWWDVDIVQQRDKYFLAKFLSPLTGEEDAWLPLNNLRLKNRKSDDWDCNLLKRGMDVSVMCTHPDQKELKLHSRALYDAKIVHIAKATHKFECTCKFHVRFYCVSTEDPIGLTRERLLLNHPSASRDVTISTVTILQQPGIVPFYEILKSHLSKKWIQAGRWSNDAFFLRETKLNLHVPPDCGENRLYDDDEDDGLDEALLATGATRLDKPEAFTYSFRVQHSREQATKENPVDQDRPYANFREPPDPPQKNRGDHFTVTAGDPGVKDNSASEPDICSVGVLPESRGVKPVFDKEIPQTVRSGVKRARDDIPHLSKNPQEASVKQVKKKSTSQPNEGRELYEREVYRRCNENRQSSEISSEKGNFEDEMVDIGGGSSDEDDLSIQAPAKTSYGINPQNSGGRCDNAVQNQGHPYPPLSKTIESKRLRRSRRRCDDALQNQDSAYSPPLKKVDGKNLRTSGRRVDDAGQKQGRLYTPPVTTNDGKSLHTSGRRSDEGLRKRGRPRQNAEGSPTKIKPDAGFKSTNQADISGVSLATKEDEDVDCEILETDPTIMARLTEQSKSLKGRQKKTEVCIDNETFDKPKNPLSRLRPRNSGKKQTFGTGGNIPGSHRQPVLKPTLGKEGGQVPLYMDLLVDNLVPENETEEQVDDISKGQGQAKKPKCGMNEDWDPTSFKYDIPTLEEKQAELQQQQQQQQQEEEEEDEEEEQQEKPPIADCPSDLMEREADEEVVTLDVDPEGEGSLCKEHDLYLKEDVGMICKSCALVVISIENLVPSLGIRQPRHCGEASDWDAGTKSPDHFQETAEYQKLQAEKDVTWMSSCKLPPRIQNSMHPHQKDGFAFLWRNLAIGEGNNRTMREDRNTGCILSHAPGTGKTFLVIAFLQSYINNFPTCRPLIVAPKIMLRQWEKEFERWKSDISVYILNTARESGKRLLQMHEDAGVINSKNLHLSSKRLLDTFRLAMLYEWSKNRSVIIVSYNLFACLTDENRDHLSPEGEAVRKTLLEKPSLLILDEGHFPRNKGTRIRKSLMSVKTNVRILLSGTLFQNNFEELFNTLYLVRPGFVEGFASFVPNCTDEDGQPNVKKFSDIEDVTKEAEKIARKLFVEEVGLKIEQGQSSKARSDDLDYGLERLGALTTEFVHHHTGGVLEALPGLRDFAVILKPTQQQSSILELLQKYFHKPNQYLEREIAVSQTSIHPILVNTLEFTRSLGIFNDFREQKLGASAGSGSVTGPASGLSKKEAKDPSDGVKTKFVFDLLCYSKPAKEKVLIFSQHLTPLELLAEMFVTQFRWRETYEYLKLDGQLSLDERAKIIEKFNNPSSEACVLLASTKACGEGVSLIGASRVVFLDVLWNPAVIKQAMSRAFRLGQKKIVYVYRLIASGTIEEHKYKKAIRKDWLSRSIFSASQGEGLKASEINREVRKSLGIIDDKGEDIKPSGATIFAKAAQEQEVLDANHATGVTRSVEQGDEGVHRLRKIQELLAWEVDVAICKDVMLEKILGKDKVERKTFLKVIEHGSDFRDENIPFGPDAREWFLEGMEDNEPLDMKEVNDEAYPAILSDSDEDDM